MQEWWGNMAVFEKIFWFFAIPFSVVFLIQLILTFVGAGDTGDDADGFDNDQDDGFEGAFKPFTVKNFIIFFTVFGWAGIALYNSGAGYAITVIIALIIGIIVMLIVAGLFYLITKLAQSGNVSLTNAVGRTGRVYIPIPANESGTGKIHITFQGAFREVDAITSGEKLASGASVRVVDVLDNNVLLVEKNKEEGW